MAESNGVKISLLPAASSLGGTDVLAGVQGNTTKKFSLSTVLAWLKTQIAPADIGAVPTSRKVNDKALTADVSLTASDVGAAEPPALGSITLSATWTGAASPYSQTVTVTGATVTASSKVDLQTTAAQIASLIGDGVRGLVIENNNGTLTAWAVGNAPSSAMTVQCTVEEVEA